MVSHMGEDDMTLDERITIGLMFARPTIKSALNDAAIKHGLDIHFSQWDDGLWLAEWTVGRQRQCWSGPLVDMWNIAHGRTPWST